METFSTKMTTKSLTFKSNSCLYSLLFYVIVLYIFHQSELFYYKICINVLCSYSIDFLIERKFFSATIRYLKHDGKKAYYNDISRNKHLGMVAMNK